MKQIVIDISDDAEAGILAEIAGSKEPGQTVVAWAMARLDKYIHPAERKYQRAVTEQLQAKVAQLDAEDRAEVDALIAEKLAVKG